MVMDTKQEETRIKEIEDQLLGMMIDESEDPIIVNTLQKELQELKLAVRNKSHALECMKVFRNVKSLSFEMLQSRDWDSEFLTNCVVNYLKDKKVDDFVALLYFRGAKSSFTVPRFNGEDTEDGIFNNWENTEGQLNEMLAPKKEKDEVKEESKDEGKEESKDEDKLDFYEFRNYLNSIAGKLTVDAFFVPYYIKMAFSKEREVNTITTSIISEKNLIEEHVCKVQFLV